MRSAPPPVPALPVPRGRRRWPLPVAAAVVLAALAPAAWRWWPETTPDALAVESVSTAVDPGNGAGSCPAASYRVSAVVMTNGGPGTFAFSWELPDGRTAPADSVAGAAGQERVDLSLSFDVTGSGPVSGAPLLVVSAPGAQRVSAPPVAYTC